MSGAGSRCHTLCPVWREDLPRVVPDLRGVVLRLRVQPLQRRPRAPGGQFAAPPASKKRRTHMRITLLTGLVVACATSAFAGQTAQPPASAAAPGSANQTMTLIGCVGGGAAATDPFMLSNASPVSVGSATPGQVTTAPPATPPSAPAAPATPTAAAAPATPTAAGAPATPTAPPPATAGTAGASGTAGTAGTAGTVGTATGSTMARPGAAGAPTPATTPAAAAPVTSPGSSPVATTGYRLSGADVSGFRGQRVQIVGSLVQPASSATASAATPGATTTGVREFKVQSVQAISGSCPQQ